MKRKFYLVTKKEFELFLIILEILSKETQISRIDLFKKSNFSTSSFYRTLNNIRIIKKRNKRINK